MRVGVDFLDRARRRDCRIGGHLGIRLGDTAGPRKCPSAEAASEHQRPGESAAAYWGAHLGSHLGAYLGRISPDEARPLEHSGGSQPARIAGEPCEVGQGLGHAADLHPSASICRASWCEKERGRMRLHRPLG